MKWFNGVCKYEGIRGEVKKLILFRVPVELEEGDQLC